MRWNRPTQHIMLVYLAFGILWIIASDWVIGLLASDPVQLLEWQSYKGVAFVALTAALFYGLIRYHEIQRAKSEAHARMLLKHSPAALAMFDRDLCFLEVSDRWRTDFDLPPDLAIIGRSHYEIHPDIPQRWRDAHQQALRGEVISNDEDYFVRLDGRTQWQRWEVRPWYSDETSIGGIIIFAEDITERKEAEKELRIAAKAFDSRHAMLILGADQRILRVNAAFAELSGFSADELLGADPAMFYNGAGEQAFHRNFLDQIAEQGEWQGELSSRRKNGQVYPLLLQISGVFDDHGELTHYVLTGDDLSENKKAAEQIHQLSYYDVLTKLPNRRLLMDRLQQAILNSATTHHYGALMFIDIDNFSALNDTQGHEIGDRVLIETGRTIVETVAPEDTVARLGSDEFVVVVENLQSSRDAALLRAQQIGERLLKAIRTPRHINGQDYVFTASMGISLFSGARDTVADLFQRADTAMVQVKRIGRDALHFFDADMAAALKQRVELETLLRDAIPSQLVLYYQPQVSSGGRVIGAEALIRWRHPEKGLVPPAQFIPLAEESGLILPMGRWILQTACEQLARWAANPKLQHITLSVNVSPKQYQRPEFVDLVSDLLEKSGADPQKLMLEVTETVLFDDLAAVTEKMQILRERGVRFSLDDFGTGFSSLAYLRQLPVEELKIDQSFVAGLTSGNDNAAIVRTVVTLGRSLGLKVIAEGVETEAARSALIAEGCDRFQGFLFAGAMPVEAFEEFSLGDS